MKKMATNLDYVSPDKKVEAEPRKPESKGEPRKRKCEEIAEGISQLQLQDSSHVIKTDYGKFYRLLVPLGERELRLIGKQDLCCFNKGMGICMVHDPSVRQPDATNLTMGDVLCIRHGSPGSIRKIIEARDKACLKMQLERGEKKPKTEDMDCDEIPSEIPKRADELKDC